MFAGSTRWFRCSACAAAASCSTPTRYTRRTCRRLPCERAAAAPMQASMPPPHVGNEGNEPSELRLDSGCVCDRCVCARQHKLLSPWRVLQVRRDLDLLPPPALALQPASSSPVPTIVPTRTCAYRCGSSNGINGALGRRERRPDRCMRSAAWPIWALSLSRLACTDSVVVDERRM